VVKFVEIAGLPNKKAWKVGNELWINLSNPSMQEIYKELQRVQSEQDKVTFVSILLNILSYKFDEAIQDLVSLIKE